jgi:hypothetical protein
MKKLIALLLVLAPTAHAETFLWDAPTTYTDGRPIEAGEIVEYRLYDGGKHIATAPGDQTTVNVPALSRGTHTMTVTAVGKDGESDPSEPLTVSVRWMVMKPKNVRFK